MYLETRLAISVQFHHALRNDEPPFQSEHHERTVAARIPGLTEAMMDSATRRRSFETMRSALCKRTSPAMTKYLLVFAQAHERFRIPELLSVSELFGLSLRPPDDSDTTHPYMILDLENEAHAKTLVKRCILIKYFFASSRQYPGLTGTLPRSIYEFYAQGATYEEIHERNRKNQSKWSRYINDTSFKFTMASFNHTIPQTRQREVIESFSYMGFMGRIDLENPEITIGCFEECKVTFIRTGLLIDHHPRCRSPRNTSI